MRRLPSRLTAVLSALRAADNGVCAVVLGLLSVSACTSESDVDAGAVDATPITEAGVPLDVEARPDSGADAGSSLDAGADSRSERDSDPPADAADAAATSDAAGEPDATLASRFPFDPTYPVAAGVVGNAAAYIPPQCFTQTIDPRSVAHNSCYACHTRGAAPNYTNDSDLQRAYSFPSAALENPWTNLFDDNSAPIAAMSDAETLDYVRTDNYLAQDGTIMLADLLRRLPANWDLDRDGRWDGYVPDAYFHFDADGFDSSPSGELTGWRAFAYYPFLGTFWPTNGSTDDVLIRLDPAFRVDEHGTPDRTIYRVNLAVVEALIKRTDVPMFPVDEAALGVDLDRDGRLSTARRVTYSWAPLEGRTMSYVGGAKALQAAGRVAAAAGLFPRGTEFLHSVRYIDVGPDGEARLARRMKELRYARKSVQYTYYELEQLAQAEGRERAVDPDALRHVPGDYERGLFAKGWTYQGFIEDRHGDLRPQNSEETLHCMGCHSGIGATTDTIFSFSRKLGASAQAAGWYHWTQGSLRGAAEPVTSDGKFEYTNYLVLNGAGDEFRGNQEVQAKFFDLTGALVPDAVARLHSDVTELLLPSATRALAADKAYRVIVNGQGFAFGRAGHVLPVDSVHRRVQPGQATGL